jgi:hypothetical protein
MAISDYFINVISLLWRRRKKPISEVPWVDEKSDSSALHWMAAEEELMR